MVHVASKKAYSSYSCACIRWAQSIWKHTSNVLSSLPEDARDGFKSRRRESCALLCWMGCCRCLSAPFALYVRPSLVSMQAGSLCRIPEEKTPLNEWIRARAASQKLGSCLPRHLDCLKCRSSRVWRRLCRAPLAVQQRPFNGTNLFKLTIYVNKKAMIAYELNVDVIPQIIQCHTHYCPLKSRYCIYCTSDNRLCDTLH